MSKGKIARSQVHATYTSTKTSNISRIRHSSPQWMAWWDFFYQNSYVAVSANLQ